MNIELYIENLLVELSDKLSYSINREFEDLSDPTAIINDWSKTVSIPGTAANNKLFGSLYRAERQAVHGSGVGIFFDPTIKLAMRLMYNNDVIMNGYAKMNSITKKAGNITYNITLNGQLGALLQEYKKMTFDDTVLLSEDEAKYYIDTTPYVNTIMNKDLIYTCWSNEGSRIIDIDEAKKDGKVYNFIGFTPNNSYMDNFDYKTFQSTNDNTHSFTETLETSSAFIATGVNADSVIGEGITPRGIGEYRSYHLIPFIYFNKLFLIVQKKAEQLSDYKWELDETWFNKKNQYWADLTYILEPIQETSMSYCNTYLMKYTTRDSWVDYYYITTNKTSSGNWKMNKSLTSAVTKDVAVSEKEEQISCYENGVFTIPTGYYLSGLLVSNIYIHAEGCKDNSSRLGAAYGIALTLTFDVKKGNTTTPYTLKKLIRGKDSAVPTTGYTYSELVTMPDFSGDKYGDYNYEVPFDMPIIYEGEQLSNIKLETKWKYTGSRGDEGYWIVPITKAGGSYYSGSFLMGVSLKANNSKFNIVSGSPSRSYSKVTISSFWNMEYLLFDEILRYCKTFGILITVDEINKKVKFTHRTTFFLNYTIEDWSNKIDYSQDYTITPVLSDSKYMLFQYDGAETFLNNQYKDDYGYNYGEIRLGTNYNFNTDTKNIMPEGNCPLIYNEQFFSWTNLYDKGKIIYSAPKDIFVCTKDDDGKYISTFGSYYFKCSPTDWDTALPNLRSVYITDDTPYMIGNNTFMYNLTGNYSYRTSCDAYTSLIIESKKAGQKFNTGVLTTYTKPKAQYYYNENIDENSKGIYDIFWEKWLKERLSTENKKLTCYVNMTPVDYYKFDFNKFVTIDGVLYMINKIYDYDISSDKTTKIDLIQITDISAYTDMQYLNNSIYMYYENIGYINGALCNEWYRDNLVYSPLPITFSNGTDTITVCGIQFKIFEESRTMLDGSEYNYVIRCKNISKYNLSSDSVNSVTIKSAKDSKTFKFTRYRDYPNPATMSVYGDLEDGVLPAGTGTIIVDVRTLYEPENISFECPTGLSFTIDEWESYNDDYVGQKMYVTFNNQLLSTASFTIKVVTGSGYILTKTISANKVDSTITLSSSSAGYVNGARSTTETYQPFYAKSALPITFDDGTDTKVIGGLTFKISPVSWTISGVLYNYLIWYQKTSYYNSDNDTTYSFTVKNAALTSSAMSFIRYRDYPNPPTMSVYGLNDDGNLKFGESELEIVVHSTMKPIAFNLSTPHTNVSITGQSDWEREDRDEWVYVKTIDIYNSNKAAVANTIAYNLGLNVTTGSSYGISKTVGVLNGKNIPIIVRNTDPSIGNGRITNSSIFAVTNDGNKITGFETPNGISTVAVLAEGLNIEAVSDGLAVRYDPNLIQPVGALSPERVYVIPKTDEAAGAPGRHPGSGYSSYDSFDPISDE